MNENIGTSINSRHRCKKKWTNSIILYTNPHGKKNPRIPGQQELEDDLRDHWRHRAHNQERLRLIHKLLKFANDKICRVTIISGDVHVGASGIIEANKNGNGNNSTGIINQLISSAIVHPPPPTIVNIVLENLSNENQINREIISELVEFPETGERFIQSRNWLSLRLDNKDLEERIRVEWQKDKQSHL